MINRNEIAIKEASSSPSVRFVLYSQPFLSFAVFIAVLVGYPALWIAWLIALAPVLVRLITTGRISIETPLDVPITIGIVVVAIGVWRGPDIQLAWTGFNSFIACVLLYYGIVNNAHAPKSYWVLWCAFVSIVVLFLTVSIFRGAAARYVVFNMWVYGLAARLHLPFAIPGSLNVTGDVCAVLIPGLLSVALFRQQPWFRWTAAILTVLFAFLIFISASGGGWIVAAAVSMLVLLRFSPKVVGAAAVLLAGAVAALVSFRSTAWESSVFHAASVTGRFEVWKGTLTAMKDCPSWLLGFGLGGWWSSVPPDVAAGANPHNAYLQLYSDTGLVGIAALLLGIIILAGMVWRIWRSDRNNPFFGAALGVSAGVIAFGLHALVEVNTNLPVTIGNRDIYFVIPFIWMWLAFLVVVHHRLIAAKTGPD